MTDFNYKNKRSNAYLHWTCDISITWMSGPHYVSPSDHYWPNVKSTAPLPMVFAAELPTPWL